MNAKVFDAVIRAVKPNKPVSISLCHALALVMFFLPFCSFKCEGDHLGTITGIDLIKGTHINIQQNAGGNFTEGDYVPPRPFAIAAFAAAAACLVLCFLRFTYLPNIILGSILVVVLYLLRIEVTEGAKSRNGHIETTFHEAYWFCLFFTGAAILLSLRAHAKEKRGGNMVGPPVEIGT